MTETTGAYFDNNATTPLDPRVREAMITALNDDHGNPSSAHRWGREARRALETARAQVADLLGAEQAEVVFTSSGTESNNMVIYAAGRSAGIRGHLITTTLEHPSVHAAVTRMKESGMEVTSVRPDASGVIQPEAIEAALRDDTKLVCLMLANNEVGTIQPVSQVAAICRSRGVPVLCDAAQAVGKIPVQVRELGVDFLVLGGHKFHAPLGAAALWIRQGAKMESLLVGAHQEGGRRAGTENVPAAVGLGKAAELAAAELDERHARLLKLRTRFEQGLEAIPNTIVHSKDAPRVPHTTHVAFPGLLGYDLMMRLAESDFAVSLGAACMSSGAKPSPVLVQMGVAAEESMASLRVSFGIFNTAEEVDSFLQTLVSEVASLRAS